MGETVLGEEDEEEGEWGVEGGALVTCSADDSIRFWRLGREVRSRVPDGLLRELWKIESFGIQRTSSSRVLRFA
jgi:hypothetical protein